MMKRRSKAGGKVGQAGRKAVRAKGVLGRRSIAGTKENGIARLTRERDEAIGREKATAEVLRAIGAFSGSLEPVFQAILENGTRICEAKFGVLWLNDPKGLRCVALYGVPRAYAEQRQREPLIVPGPETALGRVVSTKQVIHIEDIKAGKSYLRRDPLSVATVELAGARTFVAVPALKSNDLKAVISIYRQEVRPFTDWQIELLQNFAAQAVIAIENARLLSELRQSLEQQTATADVLRVISSSPGDLEPVFQAMLEKAVSICDAKFGTLFRFDGSAFLMAARVNTPAALAEFQKKRAPFLPPSGSNLDRMMKTKRVQHSADDTVEPVPAQGARLGGARSIVHVPMLQGEQLVGALVIYRQEVRPFTEKQIELLKNFAAQAVIAIENARLLSELRESLDRQTATADILRVIAGTPEDSKRSLDTIAETASRMFDAANINFRRLEGNVLRIVSSAGPTVAKLRKALPDIPLEPSDPAVRAVLDNKQIPIEDRLASLKNEYGEIARTLRDLDIRSQVFTPLSREGKAIGVMIVSRSEVRPFQEHELELMKGFADQAVIAIENARLLAELRQRTEEVSKLNQQLEQRVADQVGEIERMGRLRRFLPPQVADLIVASGTEKQLESHRREITALFCDLRGFTGFSESSDPEDVMALLADYHAAIGTIINKYSGTLERYAGDGVMVIFNDPVPVENPALQAVLMSLEMRTAIEALMAKWRLLGHDIGFGIGIAHGFATLGTIGFEGRRDYAAIGTVSNVASRLCDEAKPGQILISPRVMLAVDKAVKVESVGEFELKGIRRPMMAYNVLEASLSKPS